MGNRSILVLSLVVGAALAPGSAAAQQLSLAGALARAETNAFGNRIADATAREQGAQRLKPLSGILPTVRVDAGLFRTTDPVAAFGTTLRQRRIQQADFDPARLNYPATSENYAAALIVEQPILNLDAHLGRGSARQAADAANATRDWSRAGTRLDVIKAYYGAVLAGEKVQTLAAAVKAARAHVDHAEKLVAQGLATRSDALLARVKAGEMEAELLSAQGEARLARRQLATLLGTPADTAFQLPAQLPSFAAVQALLSRAADVTGAIENRADVRSADKMARAATLDLRRSQSTLLPRMNAFARYDWNSPTSVFSGNENWTVGVMASWTLFNGGSDWGDRSASSARSAAARAGLEAARAQAALETESTLIQRDVARARLDIAMRGAEQSAEAHRIVSRKYEGGLATVVELLDAAASETQSSLAFSHARFTGVVAEASYLRATGRDPAEIANQLDTQILGALK